MTTNNADNRPPHQDTAETYSRVAPLYDLLDLPFEWARYRRLRQILCAGVQGSVLEAGVGTGRNLAFYPPGVQVTGMDLSPAMLARARQRRLPRGVSAEFRTGDTTDTGLANGQFDAVVSSFLLCVLPHEQRLSALREMARVCRDGGEIRLMEYQRSQKPVRRALQAMWEPWVRHVFGADFDVDLDQLIDDAGLTRVESRLVVDDIIRYVVLRP